MRYCSAFHSGQHPYNQNKLSYPRYCYIWSTMYWDSPHIFTFSKQSDESGLLWCSSLMSRSTLGINMRQATEFSWMALMMGDQPICHWNLWRPWWSPPGPAALLSSRDCPGWEHCCCESLRKSWHTPQAAAGAASLLHSCVRTRLQPASHKYTKFFILCWWNGNFILDERNTSMLNGLQTSFAKIHKVLQPFLMCLYNRMVQFWKKGQMKFDWVEGPYKEGLLIDWAKSEGWFWNGGWAQYVCNKV